MFQVVEELAGAKHVTGRGWYGLRRVAADMAEAVSAVPRFARSLADRAGGLTRRARLRVRLL
jgi:hypothetical protein